jgi:hypothetical protein
LGDVGMLKSLRRRGLIPASLPLLTYRMRHF